MTVLMNSNGSRDTDDLVPALFDTGSYRVTPAEVLDALEAARQDVQIQRGNDAKRPVDSTNVLAVRFAAILDAERQDDLNPWDPYPLRQALVDAASACEEWAARLPRPTVPHKKPPPKTRRKKPSDPRSNGVAKPRQKE